ITSRLSGVLKLIKQEWNMDSASGNAYEQKTKISLGLDRQLRPVINTQTGPTSEIDRDQTIIREDAGFNPGKKKYEFKQIRHNTEDRDRGIRHVKLARRKRIGVNRTNRKLEDHNYFENCSIRYEGSDRWVIMHNLFDYIFIKNHQVRFDPPVKITRFSKVETQRCQPESRLSSCYCLTRRTANSMNGQSTSYHFTKCLSNKTKHDLELKTQRSLDAFTFHDPEKIQKWRIHLTHELLANKMFLFARVLVKTSDCEDEDLSMYDVLDYCHNVASEVELEVEKQIENNDSDVEWSDISDKTDDTESPESENDAKDNECLISCNISIEDAHPLAVKLNKLLQEGKIPENCIYYKFINDTTTFAMIDPTSASNFKWDDEVAEFFSTIKYLGGERTRKFIRGPGFLSIGKGGLIKECHAGYTTESGVIKPHLQSLHAFSQHPKAKVNKIIETDTVQVIPVVLASDGTALKPGLEYDQRQKAVVGLTHKVDASYVKQHPVPDPEEIKNKLITCADVTCAISLDNNATMPLAVHYRPKSVSGEDIFSSMENEIKTIQTCERCLELQQSSQHIVTSEMSTCSSKCEECLSSKSVCFECSDNGQVSDHTSLRSCDACLANGETCNKLAVVAVSTDCKSIRCSWSKWFIDLDGECSNVVLLRTLRDDADPSIRKELRKLLTLECVRNMDRMAVEPIVRVTRSNVLKVLEQQYVQARNHGYTSQKGIVFIAERGASAISFVDLSGCVEIKPNLLKRRVDLIMYKTIVQVNRICAFNGTVVFTDTKAGQVKQYHPVDSSVSVFLGSGETKSRDGTQSICSFAQVQGICNMENTLFVTDVSAGKVKLVTGLSSTITFLQMLGSFYDAFEIHPKCVPGGNVNEVSLQSAREKVKEVERRHNFAPDSNIFGVAQRGNLQIEQEHRGN
ncbi:Hypothetical predicted protein, partial [Paramuricea clavata]